MIWGTKGLQLFMAVILFALQAQNSIGQPLGGEFTCGIQAADTSFTGKGIIKLGSAYQCLIRYNADCGGRFD